MEVPSPVEPSASAVAEGSLFSYLVERSYSGFSSLVAVSYRSHLPGSAAPASRVEPEPSNAGRREPEVP